MAYVGGMALNRSFEIFEMSDEETLSLIDNMRSLSCQIEKLDVHQVCPGPEHVDDRGSNYML